MAGAARNRRRPAYLTFPPFHLTAAGAPAPTLPPVMVTLPAPAPAMMSYRGYNKPDRIQNLWVMYLPGRIRICGKTVLPNTAFCEEHFKRR